MKSQQQTAARRCCHLKQKAAECSAAPPTGFHGIIGYSVGTAALSAGPNAFELLYSQHKGSAGLILAAGPPATPVGAPLKFIGSTDEPAVPASWFTYSSAAKAAAATDPESNPKPPPPRPPPLPPTMAGLYAEVFYNYPYGTDGAQPNPIPASLVPDYVTYAPNVNYKSGANDTVGIQLLAQTNTDFAIRFSGAFRPSSPIQVQICR